MGINSELEERALDIGSSGDWERAATLILRHYGPELYGYIAAIARNHAMAEDAFSLCCESVWLGLPRFERRSSLRTWLYVLARRSFFKLQRKQARRREERLGTITAQRIADEVVEGSRKLIRDERETVLEQLRSQLDADEQTLLILRLDRKMSWGELAVVFYVDEALDDEELRRQAVVRLRKRYSRVKEKIRRLGLEQGLIDEV